MKKSIFFLPALFFLANGMLTFAQNEWIKIYGNNEQGIVSQVIETYDKGYLLSGSNRYYNQLIKNAFIIKTDVNGEILWKKTIGSGTNDHIGGLWVGQTYDGGYILLGDTYNFSYPHKDVFIMKLNACGESEWTKAFVDPNMDQQPYGVVQMSDSSYLMRIQYWGDDLNHKRIWLFKISPKGAIVWQKFYANWQPQQTNNEEGYNLIKKNDNEYLITGKYSHTQPGQDSTIGFHRPLWIAVDSAGNELWHTFWGIDDFYVGEAYKSAFNTKGDIYSAGRNESAVPSGAQAALFKLDSNGNQLYTANVPDSTSLGIATTISIAGDSVLFIGSSYDDWNNIDHNVIFKTDTLGNILAQRELLQTESTFRSSLITYDNKLLLTGSFYIDNNWDIYLWKFNKYLEYDSIYTQPRVYDSLCPHEIVSDTIDLDTTTVNLQELCQQMHRIQVRPNPAASKLYITLGDLTNGTELKLYNTGGQAVKQVPVQRYKREYEINITGLPPGLYVVVLFDKGKVADKRKVIISGK